MSNTNRKEITMEYLQRYNGEISKNAMAKIMFEDHKDVF